MGPGAMPWWDVQGCEAPRAEIDFNHFSCAQTASPGVFFFFIIIKLAFSPSETNIKNKMLKIYIMFNLSYSKNTGLRESVNDRALLCLAHFVSHLLIYQGS